MKPTRTLSLSFFVLHRTCVSVHKLVACTPYLGGVADRGGHRQVVVGGGHLHNDYLFSGMRQKTARQRSNREHRKLISMWFRLRQRARRLGRHRRWESGHGKQHVRAGSKKFFLFPDCLHTLSLCLCTSACVCPPIHLESCDSTRVVMHSVKSSAINSRTVLGFPVKYCRSPVMFKESAYLCSVMFYVLWVLRVL